KTFDRLYSNMVAAGEAGGGLDVILQRLAEFMGKAQKLKRKGKGAMVYPICVIGFAFLVVTGIMKFVVPKFKEIFNDFGQKLPGPTQFLLDVSDFVVGVTKDKNGKEVDAMIPGWAIIVLAPVAFFAIFKLIGHFEATRFGRDAVLIKMPL